MSNAKDYDMYKHNNNITTYAYWHISEGWFFKIGFFQVGNNPNVICQSENFLVHSAISSRKVSKTGNDCRLLKFIIKICAVWKMCIVSDDHIMAVLIILANQQFMMLSPNCSPSLLCWTLKHCLACLQCWRCSRSVHC